MIALRNSTIANRNFFSFINGPWYHVRMYEPRYPGGLKNNRNIHGNRKNEVEGLGIIHKHPDVSGIAEYIQNKFYFVTLNGGRKEAKSTSDIHFFSIDNELIYNNFYNDFGPLNIACLYKYCCKVNKKLRNPAHKNKQIVHYTSKNEETRANSAFLIASYAILYLNKSPKEAYKILFAANDRPLKPFQDASIGSSIYNIHLIDCLNAIEKAASFGFFNFNDFDLEEYEKYEDMRYGDLNWMVPQKFLAFVGPSTEPDTPYHPPECYIDYFLKNGVTAVVRLNKQTYDPSRFTDEGIAHYHMFFPDGTVPPRRIVNQFLQLAENTSGPIAVHCKAGLGRTGSLIAAYLIKHYKMSARQAIAWIRICRPGSVIGHQQAWLENMEKKLLNAGQLYKMKYYGDGDVILHHKRGIYSIANKIEKNIHYSSDESKKCDDRCAEKTEKPKLTRIRGKLRSMSAADEFQEHENDTGKYRGNNLHVITQGDKLNEIKINRYKLSRGSESQKKNYTLFNTSASSNSTRKRK